MKLSVRLTLDGMIRALRWRGIELAETAQARPAGGDPFMSLGEAAGALVDKAMQKGRGHDK